MKDVLLRTPAVCRLAGISNKLLDKWLRLGLITCEESGRSRGSGGANGYNLAQARQILTVSALRAAGAPYEEIEAVMKALRERGKDLASTWLVVLEGKVYELHSRTPPELKNPRTGQAAFAVGLKAVEEQLQRKIRTEALIVERVHKAAAAEGRAATAG